MARRGSHVEREGPQPQPGRHMVIGVLAAPRSQTVDHGRRWYRPVLSGLRRGARLRARRCAVRVRLIVCLTRTGCLCSPVMPALRWDRAMRTAGHSRVPTDGASGSRVRLSLASFAANAAVLVRRVGADYRPVMYWDLLRPVRYTTGRAAAIPVDRAQHKPCIWCSVRLHGQGQGSASGCSPPRPDR